MKQIAHETDGLIFQPADQSDVYKSGMKSNENTESNLSKESTL